MRFQRLRNPIMSIPLIPWYVPEEENVLSIAMRIHQLMEYNPENVYVLACMENGCRGISVVSVDNDTAVYWQANAQKGFRYSNTVLNGLKLWAKSRGAKKMWLNTNSESRKRLYKRYGFTPCEDGMECVL